MNSWKLDVRTKIILLCYTNFLLFQRITGWLEWVIILYLAFLMILSKKTKLALHFILVFALFVGVDYLFLEDLMGPWGTFISMIVVGGRFLFPCMMAGNLFMHTTTAHEFIVGFRSWKVPESICIPFAVMLRFLPTIKRDYHMIQRSLKTRGIFLDKWTMVKQPMKTFEYIMIPLLMSANRTSQDLTIAAMTKGIGIGKQQTIFNPSTFTWRDVSVFFGIGMLSIGIGVNRWLL